MRRRELADAKADLARAERDRQAARDGVARAAMALADARDATAAHGSAAHAAQALEWYRFWILRLDHEHRAARSRLEARDADVAAAAAACLRTRVRCESLERLREKALRAHRLAEAATERKAIDELAARRFSKEAGGMKVSGYR